ncbi:MAG: ABC transporter ATP-binding protein, partial [Alphaproteobacteria bacterium]|nr:ABC transporter ATP-binding protein [Alphaproteobacteria bacterium]
NGAGKSTTMKMITGYLRPSAGTVRVVGHDLEAEAIAAQAQIGYLPEGAPAYGDMTARQFLTFIAAVRGFSGDAARERVHVAAGRAGLGAVLHRPIDTLSKGFKRRVGLAQAILHDPAVLVMDEPTDGLDPNQKHAVRALLRDMAPEKAIVVSTHQLEEVEAICTRALIIDRGKIVADGTPSELLARSRYHNAVTIVLPPESVDRALTQLNALPSVAATEVMRLGDGSRQVTALAKSGASLVEEVSSLVGREGWQIKELYAEAGRLDDVFRALTTSDSAAVAE